MNGLEQRQRHTAVSTVEKRIDDLEILLTAVAAEHVVFRDQVRDGAKGQGAYDRLEAERVDAVDRGLKARVDQLHAQPVLMADTLWSRLRWIVTGR
jgi:hypothetical protein